MQGKRQSYAIRNRFIGHQINMMEKYNLYDTENNNLRNLPFTCLEECHTQKLLKHMLLALQITFPMARLRYITHIKFADLFNCQILTSACIQVFSMEVLFHLKKSLEVYDRFWGGLICLFICCKLKTQFLPSDWRQKLSW